MPSSSGARGPNYIGFRALTLKYPLAFAIKAEKPLHPSPDKGLGWVGWKEGIRNELLTFQRSPLRGGVKIENRENLGQCPNRGGRGKEKTEMSQFQFGNFENRMGGGLYFSKMSQFQLFDSVLSNSSLRPRTRS